MTGAARHRRERRGGVGCGETSGSVNCWNSRLRPSPASPGRRLWAAARPRRPGGAASSGSCCCEKRPRREREATGRRATMRFGRAARPCRAAPRVASCHGRDRQPADVWFLARDARVLDATLLLLRRLLRRLLPFRHRQLRRLSGKRRLLVRRRRRQLVVQRGDHFLRVCELLLVRLAAEGRDRSDVLTLPERERRRELRPQQPRPRRGEHLPLCLHLLIELVPRRPAAEDPLVAHPLRRLLVQLLDPPLLLLRQLRCQPLLLGAAELDALLFHS